MRLSVAVLLLQLFGNAIVLAQRDCSNLPDVPNARLSEGRQDAYQKGDTIGFTCEMGYTSGRQIKYVCTGSSWAPEHRGICRLKPCVLPDDIPNGYYQMITGDDFVFGTTIKYFCNEGYQMASKEDTRTCLINQWSNHVPVCEPLSCDAPPQAQGITIDGLPDEESPILPDRFLRFSCRGPGTTLNGSEILVCGKDGKWDKPFPNCVEVTCILPAPNPKYRILGAEGGSVTVGTRITTQCVRRGSSKNIECLSTGQWSTTFPSCTDCDMLPVPDSVRITSSVTPRQVQMTLNFQCKTWGHVLQGNAQVTCLENGQWSHPFPTCRDPQVCGPPPPLENGDFLTSKVQFRQGDWVQYQCQAKYTMQGGPYKYCRNGEWTGEIKCHNPGGCGPPPPLENGDFLTSDVQFRYGEWVQYQCQAKYKMQGSPYKYCYNGEWTGEIKCLKPCTVDPFVMAPHNIQFKHGHDTKLYATHGQRITFACIPGKHPDGSLAMGQYCNDGEMNLPTCV